MGCDCNNTNNEPIDIYVELAGNEKEHSSLRGRDEENQHPISAITNLSETIEDINTNIAEVSEDTKARLDAFAIQLNQEISEIQEDIDNIDLTKFYTKEEIDVKSEDVMKYRGQVTTKEDLPLINEKGDVYNVVKTGSNYVWTGKGWDNLSPALCLKKYATKDYVDGTLDASVNLLQEHLKTHYYEKSEVDALIENLDPTNLDKVFVYRGVVASYDKLPATTEVTIGDVYKTLDNDNKYFWNGFSWELLQPGEIYSKEEIDSIIDNVNESINSLQTEVNSYSEQINSLNRTVSNLEEAIEDKDTETDEKIEVIENKITSMERDIDEALASRMWYELG